MLQIIIRAILAYLFLNKKKQDDSIAINFKVSAIIPTYNEESGALRNCVRSLSRNNEITEIIVVDDGSDVPVELDIEKVRVVRVTHGGKKKAHEYGMSYISSDSDLILTGDSDTYFHKRFVARALPLFSDSSVGAVVGNVGIANDFGIYEIFNKVYYNAFNLWRASMSYFGQVSVCSGAATIFRRKAAFDTLLEYVQRKTDIGEDRFRTYLLLKNGWKTVFSEGSKAYTITPTGKRFIRQQIRWNKSFWLGLFYSFPLYTQFSMIPFTVDMLVNFLSRIFNILFFFFVLGLLFSGNTRLFLVALIVIAFHGVIHGVYGMIRNRDGLVIDTSFMLMSVWAYVSVFLIAPINIVAIVTAMKDKWGTR
jgi:hyaluronan synthase